LFIFLLYQLGSLGAKKRNAGNYRDFCYDKGVGVKKKKEI